MAVLRKLSYSRDVENALFGKNVDKSYTLTPYIITLCEGTLTNIDIQNFLEAGLRIVRFRMSHVTRNDKLILLSMLKTAVAYCCEKYEVSTWPLAITVDLPSGLIRTGYLKDELQHTVYLEKGRILQLTSEPKYWNKCDTNIIFIDDPFTLKVIKPNTELSINLGSIQLVCTEVVNEKTIKCKVTLAGKLGNGQFVCFRGLKLRRPPISNHDKKLLSFVKEYELDVIMINCMRTASTVNKVREYFNGHSVPIIISSICEQEGLDNIDSIIEVSDGIVLAREFISESIVNRNQMTAIQLNVCAKCKKAGKPFFISGNILEETMKRGALSCSEINDVTNAVLQGAGLMLRNYVDPCNVLTTMQMLNSVCRTVETISFSDNFWRMCLELQPPVNAAEAAVLACAVIARQSGSNAIVVLSVTGRTAIQLSHVHPEAVILTVSTNPMVARKLQLFRGVMPIIYDKKVIDNWCVDMNMRVQYAVRYGVKNEILKYKQTYTVLRKSSPYSAFCDQVSIWKVTIEETSKPRDNYVPEMTIV